MGLPEYNPSKYALLRPGKYIFRITDPPTKKRFGKATAILLKFTAFSTETDESKESNIMLWPWEEDYRILKEEIIKSANEDDWVGKTFRGEIVISPHPTKIGQKQQKIINIEPFYPEETKEEPEVEPEPEVPEVEDTTITPPLEEEGDPGPGEKDAPPEDEEEKEKDATPPSSKEDKPSPKDEIEQNKKNCPKEDDDEAPF